MQDFYLTAADELTLLDALPDWMTDGLDIIPATPDYALIWNIPVPNSDDFHAILRVLNAAILPQVHIALGGFMTPEPENPYQIFA